jgi:hypothetical protein
MDNRKLYSPRASAFVKLYHEIRKTWLEENMVLWSRSRMFLAVLEEILHRLHPHVHVVSFHGGLTAGERLVSLDGF